MSTNLPPSPDRSRYPPFEQMGDGQFEEMCCALVDKEAGIQRADLFNAPRQDQYGVDIIAQCANSDEIEAVSCKCYSSLRKGQLGLFSDEFLNHWETYWRTRKLRRFILCISADVKSKQRRAEIAQEVGRFSRIGLPYEVWGPRQLQEKLRPQQGVVSQFLGEEWVPRLCGTRQLNSAPPSSGKAFLDNAIVSQLNSMQIALSTELEAKIEASSELLRLGKQDAVERQIKAVRADESQWNTLSPAMQARALRTLGLVCLQTNKLEEAESLADEADAIALAAEPRLRALITFQRSGASAALGVLGEPKSKDGQRMRASLYLEGGEPDRALAELANEPKDSQDAEANRLRAYAQLMVGHREGALASLQRSEQIAPGWTVVRQASGIIRYGLALSPCAEFQPGAWPNPVPLELVKKDDASQQLLREAIRRFEIVIQNMSNVDDRRNFEVWKLACLANLPEKADDAQKYFTELTRRVKTHAGAVMWALARGYKFDARKTKRAIGDLLDDGRGGPEHVLALAALYLNSNGARQAAKLIDRHIDRFQEKEATELLSLWKKRIDGQLRSENSDQPPEKMFVWDAIPKLIEKAKISDDWSDVREFLEKNKNDPALMYFAAAELANYSQWDLLAPYNELLLEKVGTSDAVRLCAFVSFNTGDIHSCQRILNEYGDLFPSSQLPLDLRRLKVAAHRRAGEIAQAARAAESIASDTQSSLDLLTVIDTRVESGDLASAIPYIRRVASEELSIPQNLRLSRIARDQDPQLARALFKNAQEKGIPEALAADALDLSLGLKLGKSARPLWSLVDKVASDETSGLIKIADLAEIQKIVRHQNERASYLNQLYLEGSVPVHLIAASSNTNLGEVYWRAFNDPEGGKIGTAKPPFLLVHGGRQPDSVPASVFQDYELHLDVTALLVAGNLGILDHIEKLQRQITVPNILPQLLLQLEHEARPSQPERIESFQSILSSVEENKIEILADTKIQDDGEKNSDEFDVYKMALLRKAELSDGCVIDYRKPPESVQPSLRQCAANLRAVVDCLKKSGRLDASEYEEGLGEMGVYGEELPFGQLKQGQILIFCGNTIETLANAGLLRSVIANFEVQIEGQFFTRIKAGIEDAKQRQNIADWIAQQRHRVASGIETGKYRLLPQNPEAVIDIGSENNLSHPIEIDLLELLALDDRHNAVIWIDDRSCTGYSNSNKHPIVGVMDVIAALKHNSLIDEEEYYRHLSQLRSSNVGFVPPLVDEILFHLARAPLLDHEVVETPALQYIRRNLSSMAQLEKHLDFQGVDFSSDQKPAEIWYLLRAFRIVNEVIFAIWKKEHLDRSTKQRWSSWCWEAIRIERFSRLPANQANSEGRMFLFAVLLVGMLLGAIQLISKNADGKDGGRKEYIAWYYNNIVEFHLTNDTELRRQFVTLLVQHIESILREELPKEDFEEGSEEIDQLEIRKALLRGFVDDLPETISDALMEDKGLISSLGVEVRTVISLDGKKFSPDAFWAAAARAVNGKNASVKTADGENTLKIRPSKNSKELAILELDGVLSGKIADPILDVLSDDPQRRIDCMYENTQWFEYRADERKIRISELANLKSAASRISAVEAEKGASTSVAYGKLSESLKPEEDISWSLFRPLSTESVLRYLRLGADSGGAFEEDLNEAAKELVEDFGAVTAFQRLCGLPRAMPEPVISALRLSTKADLAKFREELISNSGSILRRFHRVSVSRLLREEVEISPAEIESSIGCLTDNWQNESAALLEVLRWANRNFESREEWHSLPIHLRILLIWTHGERITSILAEAGAPDKWIVDQFSDLEPRPPMYRLVRDVRFESSAALPDHVSERLLLSHGLGMALGDDTGAILSESSKSILRAALTISNDDQLLPHPSLLQDRRNAENMLGSFFVNRPIELMKSIASMEVGAQLEVASADEFLRDAIGKIEKDPQDPNGWFHISVIGIPWIDNELLNRIADATQGIDLVAEFNRDRRNALVVCRVLAELASRVAQDRDLRAHMQRQFVAIGRVLAKEIRQPILPSDASRDSPRLTDAWHLLEAACTLSKGEECKEVSEFLSQMLEGIAGSCPALVPIVRRAMDQFIRGFPFEHSGELWDSFVRLRSLG